MNTARKDKVDMKQVLRTKVNTYYTRWGVLIKAHLDVIREIISYHTQKDRKRENVRPWIDSLDR